MHPDWIAWKLDVSNAYGSMNRKHAQSATARFFPSQAPLLNYKYGQTIACYLDAYNLTTSERGSL